MSIKITTRGNTLHMTFAFTDEDGVVASVASAEVQLTYPGLSRFETETVTLTEDASTWIGTWDSTKSRAGWLEYHAHALADDDDHLVIEGRHRITANRASLDHDTLPSGGTQSDYGLLP